MNFKFPSTLLTYPTVPEFARKNFTKHFLEADFLILTLFAMHWFVATFITSITYDTYLYGFLGGGLIMATLLIGYRFFKGTQVMRVMAGIAMMFFSLIYIQQHLGRIEMHFHVFIGMAIISFYKDIVPLIASAITTITHHLTFNYLQEFEVALFDMPVMIFNYGCGIDIVLLHAAFVIAELIVIGYIVKLNIEHAIEINRTKNDVMTLNKELSFTSRHDPLTGLPNRASLESQIEVILQNAKRNKQQFALLFLDLDHFKNINDTLGHNIGDLLLKTVARKLKTIITNNNIVARIGGDEFIIVLSDFKSIYDVEEVIVKILKMFKVQWKIKEHYLHLSTSIGVAIYPDDSEHVEELMKFADIAMYQAKDLGRDQFSFFTSTLNKKVHKEVEIANDMYRALEMDEFELFLQPKVDIAKGEIIGAEALIRWHHFEKGMIFPNTFIPIAEKSGFIITLGRWTIQECARIIARSVAEGHTNLVISCNLSIRQILDPDLFETIENAIKETGIDPKLMALEVTESVMVESVEQTLNILNRIKRLGVQLCLDDFGTGYSSLAYLKKLPIDSIKIDKSFIDDINIDQDNTSLLLNTIIAMGKTLGLSLVAEGVEELHQLEYLKETGCNNYQGYYFSKPVPEAAYMALLK